ncbi:MAG TPA: alpha/beta fold hydrolase [Chthoniobacterales bacterium]|nr:alpha/beta fold hydrolase [Chthoniobacterales bacterium]
MSDHISRQLAADEQELVPTAAAEALQEFLRPQRAVRNLKREEAILDQAEVSRIVLAPGTENEEEDIAVYRWGNGERRILLVHGWAGKAAQFFALIGTLRGHGFSVVAFDAPAHGNSSGVFASGPAFARTALRVDELHGPFYGVVAHCLGAAGIAISLAQGLKVQRAVLLAPTAFIEPLLETFIKLRELPDPLATALRERFAARYPTGIISVPLLAKAFQIPGLIFHDPDDSEMPFWHGESIVQAWAEATLVPASGTGHWRILRDQSVIKGTVAFLTR